MKRGGGVKMVDALTLFTPVLEELGARCLQE